MFKCGGQIALYIIKSRNIFRIEIPCMLAMDIQRHNIKYKNSPNIVQKRPSIFKLYYTHFPAESKKANRDD